MLLGCKDAGSSLWGIEASELEYEGPTLLQSPTRFGTVKHYALSLKQPWAALLVHGRKSIEVRSWPTPRRGKILIHASRLSDARPEAWIHVPPELMEAAHQIGGIIGAAQLTDCVPYRTLGQFVADRALHLNEPTWYRPPVLYGFT